jgi:ribosomal protein L11 methylase PrmA
LDWAWELIRLTAPGGALIVSGTVAGKQEESIAGHFTTLGCVWSNQQRQDEWAALGLNRDFFCE